MQQLYQAVIKQVTRLNAVRDEMSANDASAETSRPIRPGTEAGAEADTTQLVSTNRVDTTLNDVFSLLSLFFLTIGKSRETPATFSQLGCMKVSSQMKKLDPQVLIQYRRLINIATAGSSGREWYLHRGRLTAVWEPSWRIASHYQKGR